MHACMHALIEFWLAAWHTDRQPYSFLLAEAGGTARVLVALDVSLRQACTRSTRKTLVLNMLTNIGFGRGRPLPGFGTVQTVGLGYPPMPIAHALIFLFFCESSDPSDPTDRATETTQQPPRHN